MDGIRENLPLIAQHSLFRDMTEVEILRAVSRLRGRMVSFQSGECLDFSSRAQGKAVGCVLSGWAQIYKYDLWGNQSILDFMMPNYILGCYDAFTSANMGEFQTVATAPGQLLLLDAAPLKSAPRGAGHELMEKVKTNFIAILSERSWRMLKKLDILSAGSLREKILTYLSYEAVFFGSTTFDIPFDRQGFADYLYIDRSALSRELGRLKAEGLIDFHRSHFTLYLTGKRMTSGRAGV